MGSVRLYAIAIDEVRDIFRANAEASARLREVAAERFDGTGPAMPGLLGKLGPVFRRAPDAPVVRPDVPNGSDVDTLLAGRYVAPHRLAPCWMLLEAWIESLAWGNAGREVTEAQIDEFDFDLVRAGVPTRYGLRSLLRTGLGIALMPPPGLAAGWVSLDHSQAMAAAWRQAVPSLEEAHQDAASRLLAWFDNFPGWVSAAGQQQRQPPDLVAILRA